jgi:hypothetical protein
VAKPDPEELRRLEALSEARRREADEIFARSRVKIEARRRAEEGRRERRRRILRVLTFGRDA